MRPGLTKETFPTLEGTSETFHEFERAKERLELHPEDEQIAVVAVLACSLAARALGVVESLGLNSIELIVRRKQLTEIEFMLEVFHMVKAKGD